MEREHVIRQLAAQLVAVERPHPLRVAIDGVDAAGKTTLADELAEALTGRGWPTIRASIDGFHNPAAIRRRRGDESPEGYFLDSFNHRALIDQLLGPLGTGGSLIYQRAVFDFRTDQPLAAPSEHAEPDSVLLFDGVFLLRPELREYFDFSIFVRADFEVTVARAAQRDAPLFGGPEAVRRRYAARYIPGQQLYLARVRPERLASVIVNNNDPLHPTIDRSSDV